MASVSNAQRAQLRRLANTIRPLVQIGKNGSDRGRMDNVDQALENHELIKVKFLDFTDQKKELTNKIVETTGCLLVSLVGNVATLYRQQPDPDRRKVDL